MYKVLCHNIAKKSFPIQRKWWAYPRAALRKECECFQWDGDDYSKPLIYFSVAAASDSLPLLGRWEADGSRTIVSSYRAPESVLSLLVSPSHMNYAALLYSIVGWLNKHPEWCFPTWDYFSPHGTLLFKNTPYLLKRKAVPKCLIGKIRSTWYPENVSSDFMGFCCCYPKHALSLYCVDKLQNYIFQGKITFEIILISFFQVLL